MSKRRRMQCPICNKDCDASGLGRHIWKKHGLKKSEQRELYVGMNLDGQEPICACGCGASVEFYGFKNGFAEFIRGHKSVSPDKRKRAFLEKNDANFPCPLEDCTYGTSQAGRFQTHLKKAHGQDPEVLYVETYHGGIYPKCACGCGESLPWKGWKKGFDTKYIRFHNDSGYHSEESVRKAAETRKQGYQEGRHSVWNDGLTRETDERVDTMSGKIGETIKQQYDSGERQAWSKGLTKETSKALQQSSETRKQRYATGEIKSWNEGLTKETDKRISSAAEKISEWHSSNNTQRFKPDEVVKIVAQCASNFEILNPERYKNKYTKLDVKCLVCKRISKKRLAMLERTPICFFCHPKSSLAQREIFDFVESMLGECNVLFGDKVAIAPKEIDIFLPSHAFGIEFNGLYWHSEAILIDSDYHWKKTQACTEMGIQLLHVFEDEWRDKQEIIKSMIRSRLNLVDSVIGARKCSVRKLNLDERRSFFNANHIDGDVKASISWGLIFSNEIVAALSLRRPQHSKYRNQRLIEIARFAVLKNHSIIGALSRLVKQAKIHAAKNGSDGLLTYVDLRYGTGEAYENIGFSEIGITGSPSFWWADVNSKVRLKRLEVKADKENNLSENDVADMKGVYRIWGCPNRILTLSVQSSSPS